MASKVRVRAARAAVRSGGDIERERHPWSEDILLAAVQYCFLLSGAEPLSHSSLEIVHDYDVLCNILNATQNISNSVARPDQRRGSRRQTPDQARGNFLAADRHLFKPAYSQSWILGPVIPYSFLPGHPSLAPRLPLSISWPTLLRCCGSVFAIRRLALIYTF